MDECNTIVSAYAGTYNSIALTNRYPFLEEYRSRSRSASTYMQDDLPQHSPLFYYPILLPKSQPNAI